MWTNMDDMKLTFGGHRFRHIQHEKFNNFNKLELNFRLNLQFLPVFLPTTFVGTNDGRQGLPDRVRLIPGSVAAAFLLPLNT